MVQKGQRVAEWAHRKGAGFYMENPVGSKKGRGKTDGKENKKRTARPGSSKGGKRAGGRPKAGSRPDSASEVIDISRQHLTDRNTLTWFGTQTGMSFRTLGTPRREPEKADKTKC